MSNTKPKLVRRSQRVAFMDVDTTGSSPEYTRMTGFTTMTNSKEPKEYTRQYVDEDAERSDVVGYAPSVEFSFDRHTDTPVHERLAEIHDKELLGDEAHVNIVSADLFTADTQGRCKATKRTYAVIPDTDGDGTDAMIYSGTMKSVSELEEGYVTSEDGWKTVEYTAGAIPESMSQQSSQTTGSDS